MKNRKVIFLPLILVSILIGYALFLFLRPVEIIAVHQNNNNSAVLVKNFPVTEQGKIAWWLKNKALLKEKYNIPRPAEDGFFSITFWLFGEGYKEAGKHDRKCFEDIQSKENCIDKNALLMIRNSKNTGLYFIADSGIYRISKKGKIEKENTE
ncbi:DUF943 family protein [Mixta intestinalis]|jgi:hypothetical protein|uniref:Uncharacterized protein n=1 Tax=Mixta intestinalis TaxID=1615494 RepID=A0A6P1PW64_9GAMM|nr:DUF943 family protein [Mixta intestinalis]QHM70025.1 hypothetical protein C7M51_00285 [Mixta intestinalis]